MRGWLAAVARERSVRRQVTAYRELANLYSFFAAFHTALFDEPAADQFDLLRAAKIRLGTMDLKIAAIALLHGLTVATSNQRDLAPLCPTIDPRAP